MTQPEAVHIGRDDLPYVDIGDGSSCHVGYRSCFYRAIPLGKIKDSKKVEMNFKEKNKIFDPKKIYKDEPNPTEI